MGSSRQFGGFACKMEGGPLSSKALGAAKAGYISQEGRQAQEATNGQVDHVEPRHTGRFL
jgi:hypothetical protein